MPSPRRPSLLAARFALYQGDRSLRQIAQAAGLAPSTVEAIAGGRHDNPGIKKVEAIAKALGVRPAWLAYGDGKPTED